MGTFYRDPLRPKFCCLVMQKAEIHNLAFFTFEETSSNLRPKGLQLMMLAISQTFGPVRNHGKKVPKIVSDLL